MFRNHEHPNHTTGTTSTTTITSTTCHHTFRHIHNTASNIDTDDDDHNKEESWDRNDTTSTTKLGSIRQGMFTLRTTFLWTFILVVLVAWWWHHHPQPPPHNQNHSGHSIDETQPPPLPSQRHSRQTVISFYGSTIRTMTTNQSTATTTTTRNVSTTQTTNTTTNRTRTSPTNRTTTNTTTNTTNSSISTPSTPSSPPVPVVTSLSNRSFCRAPNLTTSTTSENSSRDDTQYSNTCKAHSDTWNRIITPLRNPTSTNTTGSTNSSSTVTNMAMSSTNHTTHNNTDRNTDNDRYHNSSNQNKNLTEIRSLQTPQSSNTTNDNDDSKCDSSGSSGSSERQILRQDALSGECGPHCRPSCITLQLDLQQLQPLTNDNGWLCSHQDTSNPPTNDACDDNNSNNYSRKNNCVHTQRPSEAQHRCNASSLLYEQYPTCYLEDAKCFGPSLYDDIVAVYEHRWMNTNDDNRGYQKQRPLLPHLDHCTTLPQVDPLLERFHDWPLVTPMTVDCRDNDNMDDTNNETTTSCFKKSNSNSMDNDRIYFEYCNVVEEDYNACDACARNSNDRVGNGKCDTECTKIIQPFPSGWTTFVVSASIPYPHTPGKDGSTAACQNDIQYANETGVVCFVQRIEIYYPEDCPYCHSCPNNVGLGDTFGPLEVIGFGHAALTNQHPQQASQQACAPCNVASSIRTTATTSLSCSQLQQCHESVDCSTGISLGIPSYTSNQCSFQNPFSEDDDLVQEDSITDDDLVDDDDDNQDDDDDDDDDENVVPTKSPMTKNPDKKMTDPPTNVPTTRTVPAPIVVWTKNPTPPGNSTVAPPTNDPSTPMSMDNFSKEFRFSPIIATFIVIGLLVVITIQLALYKKRVEETVRQQQVVNKNTEEILYIEEPLEFDGIDKILSKKDNDSDDNGSQQTATVNDNDDNASQDPAVKSEQHSQWARFLRTITSPHRSVSDKISSAQQPQPEIRRFQTASIVERTDQNEVEALYMTGQHHVPQLQSSSAK